MKTALAMTAILFVIAPAKSIVEIFDAPAGNISGLGWENGSLWAVDALLKTVYEIDPSSGNVLGSFSTAVAPGYQATGLAVESDYVYVGAWDGGTNGYVYKYSLTGGYLGAVNMCGG